MSNEVSINYAGEVEAAFASTPYPEDGLARRFRVDAEEMDEAFRGRHWQEIRLKTLVRYRDRLSYFTREGFRFYLPAFLRAAVLYPIEVDTLIDLLISELSPPGSSDPRVQSINEHLRRKPFGTNETAAIRTIVSQVDASSDDQIDFFLARVGCFIQPERAAIGTYFEKFLALYPREEWNYQDSDYERLERVLRFWRAIAKSYGSTEG